MKDKQQKFYLTYSLPECNANLSCHLFLSWSKKNRISDLQETQFKAKKINGTGQKNAAIDFRIKKLKQKPGKQIRDINILN